MKNCLFFLTILLLFNACTKDEHIQRVERNMMPLLLRHYEKNIEETSGVITLTFFRTLAIKNEVQGGVPSVTGAILDDNGEAQDFGTLTIGSTPVFADSNNGNTYGGGRNEATRPLYGTRTLFSLENSFSDFPMYIPKAITITNFEQIAGNRPKIQEGTTINWNKDEQNDKDIIILVDCDVCDNSGQGIETIKEVILTNDDGAYTFKKKNLSQFPNNSRLQVTLIRGNYEVVTATDGREILLCNYSMMVGVFDY